MKYMPVTNKVIILDAGHGGIDSGTLNDDKTILEKDINLAITHKIRELLESSGAHVILTREDDSSLYVEDGKKTIRQKYNENLKKFTLNVPTTIDISVLATGISLDKKIPKSPYFSIYLNVLSIGFFILGNLFSILSIMGFPQ